MDFIYRFDALGSAAHTNAGARKGLGIVHLCCGIHQIINIWHFNIGMNGADRAVTSATRTLTILEHNMLQYVQYQTILVILLQYVTICLKL